jgi:ankyrin repeat protein
VHVLSVYNKDDDILPACKSALHFAANKKNLEVAQLLVSHGADVNANDTKGSAPLHMAVYGSGEDMLRFLLDQGANINAKDGEGCTPLQVAV